MRTYATILPGLRSVLRVGVCLLLTVPANGAQPYKPVRPDPMLEIVALADFPRAERIGTEMHDSDG